MAVITLLARPSQAATLNVSAGVTAIVSDSVCSLREAVQAINNGANYSGCTKAAGSSAYGTNDVINVPAATYSSNFAMDLAKSVTIVGASTGGTIIELGGQFGFSVRAVSSGTGVNPTLTLQNMTLRKIAAQSLNVIGVYVEGGDSDVATLKLNGVLLNGFNAQGISISGPAAFFGVPGHAILEAVSSTISNNSGPGIYGDGGVTVRLTTSLVSGNHNSGLSLLNGASAELDQSTVSGNSTPNDGGGIFVLGANENQEQARLFLNKSTVSGNTAGGDGGGIYWGGDFGTRIADSTISGNSAARGGGVFYQSRGVAYSNTWHATITLNTASVSGGGVFVANGGSGSLLLDRSIVARNKLGTSFAPSASGTDVYGFLGQAWSSVIGTSKGITCTGPLSGQACASSLGAMMPADTASIDPKLSSLKNLGGPTSMHGLLPGSPAIDLVGVLDVDNEKQDQRSLPRSSSDGINPPVAVDGDGVVTLHDVDAGAFELQCTKPTVQLVSNRTFETGSTSPWTASTGATLTVVTNTTVAAHGGTRSLRVSNRTQGTWQGAIYDLLAAGAKAGDSIPANGWVRLGGDPSEPALLTLRSVCQGQAATYQTIASGTATDTGWLQLSGTATVPSCTLTELTMYFEGPRTGVALYIDDASATRTSLSCESVTP
jgi:hypothetical protein